jgi:hypothetical protein
LIHKYSLKSMTRWSSGEFQVQILLPGQDRPIAYCDGTDEDVRALHAIAEEEGTELPTIHRRILKSGREIWTMGEARDDDDELED